MANQSRHTFSKQEKLKSRREIDAVFSGGKAFTAPPIRVMYLLKGTTAEKQAIELENTVVNLSNVQAGVSASKKNFRKAVDRNRIKRLLREAYRLHKRPLLLKMATKNHSLSIFFLFIDKSLPTFAVIEDKIKYCIKRLGKIVDETP